ATELGLRVDHLAGRGGLGGELLRGELALDLESSERIVEVSLLLLANGLAVELPRREIRDVGEATGALDEVGEPLSGNHRVASGMTHLPFAQDADRLSILRHDLDGGGVVGLELDVGGLFTGERCGQIDRDVLEASAVLIRVDASEDRAREMRLAQRPSRHAD